MHAFVIFVCIVGLVYLLLPLIFAAVPPPSEQEPQRARLRREVRGHILASVWVVGLLVTLTCFGIYFTLDALSEAKSGSDALLHVIVTGFCGLIAAWMVKLSTRQVRAKRRELRECHEENDGQGKPEA